MYIIQSIIEHCTDYVSNGGIMVGFFLVLLECFIPALPLSVFVALNVNAFGFLLGFFISWLATCLGSYLCFCIFAYVNHKIKNCFLTRKMVQRVSKEIERFQRIKFTELVLVITLPFTPSFLINILSGLACVSQRKFILSLVIGKSFSVIFWGFIGKSFIESLTDFRSISYIAVTLVLAYSISKTVSKKMDME